MAAEMGHNLSLGIRGRDTSLRAAIDWRKVSVVVVYPGSGYETDGVGLVGMGCCYRSWSRTQLVGRGLVETGPC